MVLIKIMENFGSEKKFHHVDTYYFVYVYI